MNTVLLVGLGDLGGHVLEFLARSSGIHKIYVADRDEDRAIRKVNIAKLGAIVNGYYPDIEFVKLDLNDISGTTEKIQQIAPNLIFASPTLQSWWVITQLPEDISQKLGSAGFGPWLPMHLTLMHKLMMAVRDSGIRTHVVSSPFPDAVNSILGKLKLAPTTGIGNIDELTPLVKKIVSEKMRVPIRAVSVFLVGHHFTDACVLEKGEPGDAPYFLKIVVYDEDVTDKLNPRNVLSARVPVPSGRGTHPLTASCAVRSILAILNDTGELVNAPGPNGLPGGYPTRLSAKGAEIVLPKELTLQRAIKINEEAQKFDGIEKIREDGSVVFTDKSVEIMKGLMGYHCKKLKVEESEERAKEISTLFEAFARKHV